MFVGPNVISDSLSLYLDPSNENCYPNTGSILYDLSGNGRDSTMVSASVNSDKHITFLGQGDRDGIPPGDHITINTDASTTSPSEKPNGVTYNIWMVFDGNQPTGHGIFGDSTRNHLEWRNNVDSGTWRTEAMLENGYSFGATNESSYGHHTIGEWFNLSIVFANDEVNRPVYWYVNGELFHTGDMTSGVNPSTEYFIPEYFGHATGNESFLYVESFKGKLGLLCMYDRSLEAGEINKNFNGFRNRFGI